MKRFFTVLLAIILLLSAFGLSGCSTYRSSYSAIGLVRSNGLHSASMSFYELKGTMVFRVKSESETAQLRCSAALETGEATVYYDFGGQKKEILTIRGGEEFDSVGEDIGPGTIFIIVETNGKCGNGSFRFTAE